MKKLYKQKEQVQAMKKLLANYQDPDSFLERCHLCDVVRREYHSCDKCVWVCETGHRCIDTVLAKVWYIGTLRNAKTTSDYKDFRQWTTMRIEQLQDWIKKYDIYGKDYKNDMDKW